MTKLTFVSCLAAVSIVFSVPMVSMADETSAPGATPAAGAAPASPDAGGPRENMPVAAKSPAARPPSPFSSFLLAGADFAASSDYTTTLGSSSSTSSQSDSASYSLGGEVLWDGGGAFGAGLTLLGSHYRYADGTPDDGQLRVTVAPRLQAKLADGRVTPWFEFGAGLMNTSFGETSATSNGFLIKLNSSSVLSFVMVPAVGVDWNIGKLLLLRTFGSLTRTSLSVDATVTKVSTNAVVGTATDSTTRMWYEAGAGMGFRF